MAVLPLVITDLTQGTLEGTGVFDALMRANKVHLEAEFQKNRIKGPEYATVYLGSLQAVMQAALTFLSQSQKVTAEIALLEAQTALVAQQTLNAVKEGDVLDAQRCKLQAEYDLTLSTTVKSASEILLLNQKTATEKAQITSMGVDDDSVTGRQKALYLAQAEGFKRAAEQKAADVLVGAFNIQRTTDDLLPPGPAGLDGANIARAVNKLLAGVGA